MIGDVNINARIVKALEDEEIPRERIKADVYLGVEELYYTFNYDAIPEDFGDNAPEHERLLIQVHFYCPHKYNSPSRRRLTQQRLYRAGFGWPEVIDATNRLSQDGKEGQHFIFECEDAQGVDYGQD